MWSISFEIGLEIAGRTALIYIALVIGVRLSGKRQIAQMTPFDLVVLLLLSNAVQNAMTGPDTTVPGGLIAASTLLLLNHVVATLRVRVPGMRQLLVGSPMTLVSNGHVQFSALEQEKMTIDDLMESLREHDCSSLSDVELASLEVDGEISIIRKTHNEAGKWTKTKKKLVRHHKR